MRCNRWEICWYIANKIFPQQEISEYCMWCKSDNNQKVIDTQEHCINSCSIHDKERQEAINKIRKIHPQPDSKITLLLSITNIKIIEIISDFVTKIEDTRNKLKRAESQVAERITEHITKELIEMTVKELAQQ